MRTLRESLYFLIQFFHPHTIGSTLLIDITYLPMITTGCLLHLLQFLVVTMSVRGREKKNGKKTGPDVTGNGKEKNDTQLTKNWVDYLLHHLLYQCLLLPTGIIP
jgi:hypothetical protein